MKNFTKIFIAFALAFATFLIACSSDPCEKKVCFNNATKTKSTDGKSCTCNCTPGYKGDSCNIEDRKYILTSHSWKASSIMVAGGEMLKDCDKDDQYTFTSGGDVNIVPMGVACSSSETTQTTTYSLSEDGKTMTYTYKMGSSSMPLTASIISFSTDKLEASGTLMGLSFSLTFVKY